MDATWKHILEVIAGLEPESSPRVLEPTEVRLLLDRFIPRFIVDQGAFFWWESLKSHPIAVHKYASKTASFPEIEAMLRRVAAPDELILIVTDDYPDPSGVLIGSWPALRHLFEEVPLFEYILTDDHLQWAIFDTHRDFLLLVEATTETRPRRDVDADRRQLLDDLLHLRRPVVAVCRDLIRFGWDSEHELAVLTRSHATSILQRYLSGDLSAQNVQLWANVIEGRDDIGFEPGFEATLKDLIFELANPILTQPLTTESARGWLRLLS